MAFNGDNFLATWTDKRDDISHIFYTTINQNGTVLNPVGTKLSGKDSSDFYSNSVTASNGNNYLVSYIGANSVGTVGLLSMIDSAGIIIDTIPYAICDDTMLLLEMTAASDGQEYLIALTNLLRGASGIDLYFQRVSNRGHLLDLTLRHIAYNYSGIFDINVAFGGGIYLVAWSDNDNIWGSRIKPDGTLLDPGGFLICSDSGQQIDPSIASDGHRFLVTWTDSRNGNYDIYATFVDSAGNVGLAENMTNPMPGRLSFNVSPNPFNKETRIKLNYPLSNNISVGIYDIAGKLVKSFDVSGGVRSANSEYIWDGKDSQGKKLPAGVYIINIKNSEFSASQKIIIQR